MDYQEFLRRLPKVELHVHLNGSIPAGTLAALAKKHEVDLVTDPTKIYDFPYVGFFQVLQLASSLVRDVADFEEITYAALRESSLNSNIKYTELFFNPTLFPADVPYSTMLDGIVAGCRAAQSDHGIEARLIPAVYRGQSPQVAVDLIRTIIDDGRDEVIGIGLDGPEAAGAPELFAEAFELAREAGLHRTAHVCEDGPPSNVVGCLDVLHCERLDHGYAILEDPALVRRVREEGVFFNTIIRAWAKYSSFQQHPVKKMDALGLNLTLNSDDPPMQHGDLALEYIDAAIAFNWGAQKMCDLAVGAIDATWLDDSEKASLRQSFEAEIETLVEAGIEGGPPAVLPYFREKWWWSRQELNEVVGC